MAEPITLEDARRQLNICDADDDSFLEDAIVDARGWVESYTGLILTPRDITETLTGFSRTLQSWPVITIGEVRYIDSAGSDATLDAEAYSLRNEARPARLFATSFPRIWSGSRVSIDLTAGFPDVDAINAYAPVLMRTMRQLIAAFYFNRETGGISSDAEESAKNLCRPYRRMRV